MKIKFNKLDILGDYIFVDFGNGAGWQRYSINSVKDNGIEIPSNVSDYSKIQIKGTSSTFKNLDVITSFMSGIQVGVPEENAISAYVLMSNDGCGEVGLPTLEFNEPYELQDQLFINGHSLSELHGHIPFEEFGFSDSLIISSGSSQYDVYRTHADNAYITSDLHLGFGSEADYASDSLLSFSNDMIEEQDPSVNIISNEDIYIDLGSTRIYSSEPNKVIEFNFPTNSVFPPDSIEETIGKIERSDTDDNYVGPNNLRLKKDSDGNYRIDIGYYKNHKYIILSGPDDSFRCVYAGPYNLDISDAIDPEYSWSTYDLYSELCKQDIYIRIGDSNIKTNLKLY
jgi:hypothetical protein